MAMRLPEIHPISELARDARALVERARQRHEPIVITQRGRGVAVLLPIQLYREIEGQRVYHVVSPRLVRREDAELVKMSMTVVEPEAEGPDAGL